MSGYALVTFVYATEQQYRAALVVDAIAWTGPEVDPAVVDWATRGLVLLTSPKGWVEMDASGRIAVTNGRDVGLVLDCSGTGV